MPDTISSSSVTPASYEVFDDPLYISTSDQPSLRLTETKFNGEHFLQWKREIYQALLAKNKEGFIDGSLRITDKKDKKFHHWNRCDLLVRRWITNSMEPSIAETVKYASSAKELWSEILERYGQTNGIEIYQLKKDLCQISQDNTSLVEYYSKLKTAWEDLDAINPIPYCSCGALDVCTCQLLKRIVDRETNSKLIHFLMGLNKGFDTVRTTVLSMEPLPPLNKALGLLQKIEKHREISEVATVNAEATAYASARPSTVTQGDWKRQKVEGVGHPPHSCFQRIRDNNGGLARGRGRHYNSGGRGNNSGGRGNVYHRNANNVDSIHFPDNPLEIAVADQNVVHPAAAGTTQIQGVDPAVIDGIMQNVMQQVYKAMSDRANSAGASSSVNFAGTDLYSQACTVAHTYGQMSWIVDTGASDHMTSSEEMLYDIKVLNKPIVIGLPDGTIKLVHKIGNIDLTKEIKLKNVLIVPDFKQNLLSVSRLIQHTPMVVLFTNKYCAFQDLSSKVPLALAEKRRGLYLLAFETCILSKFHVQPFQRSHSHAANLFDLVHLDLWGPYRTASRTGAKYFLTILDDHSRVTWVYLFQNKYQQHGIVHQRSIVGRPQQNGRVERKHRHLIETARALRVHANLPIKFWGDSVLTATYLINKMPTAILHWKTPFEVLFKRKPTYDELRVFGCQCFAPIAKSVTGKDKFAVKARKCLFIGYPYGQKGYTLYDMQQHTTFTARDVIFQEDIFPFKQQILDTDDPRQLVDLFHDIEDNDIISVQNPAVNNPAVNDHSEIVCDTSATPNYLSMMLLLGTFQCLKLLQI
ncbi:uncharacterized protein LOC141649792 [Silene latifolia]|uniref:uncharacterized protein LOC141649792 n=1 Tax=Silene latifolia TaxID=37657 RepID=UPI003D77277C